MNPPKFTLGQLVTKIGAPHSWWRVLSVHLSFTDPDDPRTMHYSYTLAATTDSSEDSIFDTLEKQQRCVVSKSFAVPEHALLSVDVEEREPSLSSLGGKVGVEPKPVDVKEKEPSLSSLGGKVGVEPKPLEETFEAGEVLGDESTAVESNAARVDSLYLDTEQEFKDHKYKIDDIVLYRGEDDPCILPYRIRSAGVTRKASGLLAPSYTLVRRSHDKVIYELPTKLSTLLMRPDLVVTRENVFEERVHQTENFATSHALEKCRRFLKWADSVSAT